MNKPWKVILAFLVVFVAGGICGGYLTYSFGPKPPERARREFRAPPPPGQFATGYLRRLTKELQLSPEQVARIQPIVAQTGEALRRQHRQNFEDMLAASEHMNEQIAQVLTPPQLEKIQAMHRRWRENRLREFGDRPDAKHEQTPEPHD